MVLPLVATEDFRNLYARPNATFSWICGFMHTVEDEDDPKWLIAQWASTGFLWSQWLIQDAENIFVYAPRELSTSWFVFTLPASTARAERSVTP